MKYFGSKNNTDFGFYNENFDGAIEVSDEQWKILIQEQADGKSVVSDNLSVFTTDTPSKYSVNEDGTWTILTDDEYSLKIQEQQKLQYINELKAQIENLDAKRIRAVCEPSIKDEDTGETWLDYYNSQIISLRANIAELEEENDENQ